MALDIHKINLFHTYDDNVYMICPKSDAKKTNSFIICTIASFAILHKHDTKHNTTPIGVFDSRPSTTSAGLLVCFRTQSTRHTSSTHTLHQTTEHPPDTVNFSQSIVDCAVEQYVSKSGLSLSSVVYGFFDLYDLYTSKVLKFVYVSVCMIGISIFLNQYECLRECWAKKNNQN